MPGQRPAIEYFVQKRRHRTDVGVGISERRFNAPVAQMRLNDREWRSISRQPGGNRVTQVMDAEGSLCNAILFRAVSNALSIVRMGPPPRYRELRHRDWQ